MKIWAFLIIFLLSSHSHLKESIKISADPTFLKNHVDSLSHIYPSRNYLNTESLNQAANYIHIEFKKHTTRVEYQPYTIDSAENKNILDHKVSHVKNENENTATREYKNIIASFGPEKGARIIIGAHYDVCVDQPGADDNASGVSGILELARLIHILDPDLKYRVDLVAYSLEEPPYFKTKWMGSAIHAKSLKQNNVDVRTMISLEMIGYFSDEEKSQDFPVSILSWFYPTTGNFIAVVGNFSNFFFVGKVRDFINEVSAVPAYSLRAPASVPGVDFSDHLNYWANGFPGLMITDTAFNRNKNYHNINDTSEKLNYEKMAEVVKGVYWAVVNL